MSAQAKNATTIDTIGPFEVAAEHFSSRLFEDSLPPHTITLQRRIANTSLFVPKRWQDPTGIVRHEIALNPTRFARLPLLLVLQSLVREQCHLWQLEFGSPSRSGYHTREWAEKMASLGFKVSADGHPNRVTGQKIILKPIADGLFVDTCGELVRNRFALNWLDRGFDSEQAARHSVKLQHLDPDVRTILARPISGAFGRVKSIRDPESVASKRKVKYGCPSCRANVWGRSGLSLICSSCDRALIGAA